MRRIIPADAGSTWWPLVSELRWADHPRGCGEHGHARPAESAFGGSSPRMRGAQGGEVCSSKRLGIIPADAGST